MAVRTSGRMCIMRFMDECKKRGVMIGIEPMSIGTSEISGTYERQEKGFFRQEYTAGSLGPKDSSLQIKFRKVRWFKSTNMQTGWPTDRHSYSTIFYLHICTFAKIHNKSAFSFVTFKRLIKDYLQRFASTLLFAQTKNIVFIISFPYNKLANKKTEGEGTKHKPIQ